MRTGDVGEITAPRLSFPTWVVFADLGDGSSLRRVCTMPATDSLSLAQDVADFFLPRQSARQAMHCLAKKSAALVVRCGHAFLAASSMCFFLGCRLTASTLCKTPCSASASSCDGS